MNFLKLLKKPIFVKPLYLLYIFNLVVLFGIVFGFLPREAILGVAFLIFFYLFLMKLEDCLFYFLASIPFFVALPVTRSFDSLNIWRIAILIIFGRVFFAKFPFKLWFKLDFLRLIPQAIYKRLKTHKLELWTVIYFTVGLVSILVAQDKAAALRRWIYVAQMILVYPLLLCLFQKKLDTKKILRFLLVPALLVLIIGLGQLAFSYFVSLGHFWGWWTWRVEQTFYGNSLANIVSRANTWFSYYSGRSPALRSFSTFTDSHSFSLYLLLSTPLVLWLMIKNYLDKKKINRETILLGIAFVLMQFLIVLSGTRGIWLSVGAPLLLGAYFTIKRLRPKLTKFILGALLVFVLMLPLSSLLLSVPQFNVAPGRIDQTLTFKRLRSILDLEEISNLGRLNIWKESIRSMVRHPFLGVGIGNFPVILGQKPILQKAGSTAHNVYLNAGVEMGIMGLIATILIFYYILKDCFKFINEQGNHALLPLLLGFYFLWIFAYSFFDVALFDARVMMVFAAEVGLVMSIPSLRRA